VGKHVEFQWEIIYLLSSSFLDRLCGLAVRVPGYRSGFDFQRYHIFWVWNVVHSALWVQLRSYLEEKVATLVYKIVNTAVGDPPRCPHGTLYPLKFALTLPTSGGRTVGIVRSRTQTTEFFIDTSYLRFYLCHFFHISNGKKILMV
jgi:hypothetical protein